MPDSFDDERRIRVDIPVMSDAIFEELRVIRSMGALGLPLTQFNWADTYQRLENVYFKKVLQLCWDAPTGDVAMNMFPIPFDFERFRGKSQTKIVDAVRVDSALLASLLAEMYPDIFSRADYSSSVVDGWEVNGAPFLYGDVVFCDPISGQVGSMSYRNFKVYYEHVKNPNSDTDPEWVYG